MTHEATALEGLLILSFVLANIAAIFITLYCAVERQYSIQMITIMCYGFVGTLFTIAVILILATTFWLGDTKIGQKLTKMRKF